MDDIYFRPVADVVHCTSTGCERRVEFLRLRSGAAVLLCGDHDREPTA